MSRSECIPSHSLFHVRIPMLNSGFSANRHVGKAGLPTDNRKVSKWRSLPRGNAANLKTKLVKGPHNPKSHSRRLHSPDSFTAWQGPGKPDGFLRWEQLACHPQCTSHPEVQGKRGESCCQQQGRSRSCISGAEDQTLPCPSGPPPSRTDSQAPTPIPLSRTISLASGASFILFFYKIYTFLQQQQQQ